MIIRHIKYPLKEEESHYESTVMAIGYFDGVHHGHRQVIQQAVNIAKEKELKASVMTFYPHPREVLGQKSGYTQYLTPLEVKLKLFQKMGVDIAYVVHFDIPFSSITPQKFIDEFIVSLRSKHIVVGFDYTFGYQGQGTANTLKDLRKGRYEVDVVAPISLYGEKISSTMIREYLYSGKMEEANRFLGRPYQISGIVIHGAKRGREIGFPTANLRIDYPYVIPKTGVYGVKVTNGNQNYFGVMNIGIKPTFEHEKIENSLEAHLFSYNGDLYGEELVVNFLFFIREEQKFEGVKQLVSQIENDVLFAKDKIMVLEQRK